MERQPRVPGWALLVPILLFGLGVAAVIDLTPPPSASPSSTTGPGGGPGVAVGGVPAPPASPAEVELEATLARRYKNLRRVGANTWEGTDHEGRGVLITHRR